MRKTVGGHRRRRLEHPSFFKTTLFAFVGDALNAINEEERPGFGYSHLTLAIRANFGDWRSSHLYLETGHNVFLSHGRFRCGCADAQMGPTIKLGWVRTLCGGVSVQGIMRLSSAIVEKNTS